jgi:hypothetical protein
MMGNETAVVSVRSSSTAKADAIACWDYINSFKKIVLSLDNDEPGESASREIASLFDPQQADLSKALPGGFVQNLSQHLRVDLLKDGLEAAAITEANVGVTSNPLPPRVSLTLDRSFLYFVINAQGLMLFSGVVHQPTT